VRGRRINRRSAPAVVVAAPVRKQPLAFGLIGGVLCAGLLVGRARVGLLAFMPCTAAEHPA
jgi:hypothetical protein